MYRNQQFDVDPRARRGPLPLVGMLAIAALGGCMGQVQPEADAELKGTAFATIPRGPCAGKRPGTSRRIRRLTHEEYIAALSDLTGLREIPTQGLLASEGGLDRTADALLVSDAQLHSYALIAERVAGSVDVRRLAPCDEAEAKPACAQRFVATFARRAYGRRPDSGEQQRLLDLFASLEKSDGYDVAIQGVMQAVLQSPSFLYRTELGVPGAERRGEVIRLTPEERAAEISFLLTGARPDEELLALAESGRLEHPGELERQVKRLLQHPRARRQLRKLIIEWFGLDDLASTVKNTHFVPAALSTDEIRSAMQVELEDFIDHVLWEGSGTMGELLTSTSSRVPPALVPIYGGDLLDAPDGKRRVRLEPARRKGIISLPGFLYRHAKPDITSPVMRGVFVRKHLLCQELPEPPPDAVATPVDVSAAGRTTRDKFSQHISQERCRGCHALIDSIGFGFENMDPLGRFRTTENGAPVDAKGELIGTDVDGAFEGPAQLGERLANSAQVRACMVTQLYAFAAARAEEDADGCELAALRPLASSPSARIQDVLAAILLRESAGLRRTEKQQEQRR